MKKRRQNLNTKTTKGIIKRHPDGFGFVISDESDIPDIYIPRKAMAGVMTNDLVEIRFWPERRGDRLRGEIAQIEQRAFSQVTGQAHRLSDDYFILTDKSYGWGEDLIVPSPSSLNIQDGDWVVARILTYPDSEKGFTGEITKVLGDVFSPLNDIQRVLADHGIPDEFSQEVLQETEKLPDHVKDEDLKGRKDLRHLPLITIDGVTAKDFDDAIYVEEHDKGFRLIVAIADVSHYVPVDSFTDEQAYERGNSTYLPNFVVPMLPEVLSNELCSLKPHVNRLAVACDMLIDFHGEFLSYEYDSTFMFVLRAFLCSFSFRFLRSSLCECE